MPGDSGGFRARVDAHELAHAVRDEVRPSTAAATEVESHGVSGKRFPGKDPKVTLEKLPCLRGGQIRLIERCPFATEVLNGFRIVIGRNRRCQRSHPKVAVTTISEARAARTRRPSPRRWRTCSATGCRARGRSRGCRARR